MDCITCCRKRLQARSLIGSLFIESAGVLKRETPKGNDTQNISRYRATLGWRIKKTDVARVPKKTFIEYNLENVCRSDLKKRLQIA